MEIKGYQILLCTGGRLVSGSENGAITVYNVEAILESAADAVVGQSDKHTGPVRALDFNPFQVMMLAGALYSCLL